MKITEPMVLNRTLTAAARLAEVLPPMDANTAVTVVPILDPRQRQGSCQCHGSGIIDFLYDADNRRAGLHDGGHQGTADKAENRLILHSRCQCRKEIHLSQLAQLVSHQPQTEEQQTEAQNDLSHIGLFLPLGKQGDQTPRNTKYKASASTFNPIRNAVTVVPMFAPMMMPMDCSRLINPARTNRWQWHWWHCLTE